MIRLLFENSSALSNQSIEELVMSFLKENGSIDIENIDQSTMDALLSIALRAKHICRSLNSFFLDSLDTDLYKYGQMELMKLRSRKGAAGCLIECHHVPFTIEADTEEDLPVSSQIIPPIEKAFSSIWSRYSSRKMEHQEVLRVSSDEVPMANDKEWISLVFDGSLGTVKGIPIISNGQKQSKDLQIKFDVDGEVTWRLPNGKKLERQLAHQEYDYEIEDEYNEDDYEGPYYDYEGPGEAEYYFRKGEHLGERFLPGDEDIPLKITVRCELSMDIRIWLELK